MWFKVIYRSKILYAYLPYLPESKSPLTPPPFKVCSCQENTMQNKFKLVHNYKAIPQVSDNGVRKQILIFFLGKYSRFIIVKQRSWNLVVMIVTFNVSIAALYQPAGQSGWSSNTSDLHLWCVWFRSQAGHSLSLLRILWFFLVPPSRWQRIPQFRHWPLPSKSFPFSNLSFTNYPVIWHYVVWNTDTIIK
jgi:hypothetical protein